MSLVIFAEGIGDQLPVDLRSLADPLNCAGCTSSPRLLIFYLVVFSDNLFFFFTPLFILLFYLFEMGERIVNGRWLGCRLPSWFGLSRPIRPFSDQLDSLDNWNVTHGYKNGSGFASEWNRGLVKPWPELSVISHVVPAPLRSC